MMFARSFLVALIFLTTLSGEAQWEQLPSPIAEDLIAVHSKDSVVLVASDSHLYYNEHWGTNAEEWFEVLEFDSDSTEEFWSSSVTEKAIGGEVNDSDSFYFLRYDEQNDQSYIFIVDLFERIFSLEYISPIGVHLIDLDLSFGGDQWMAISANGFTVEFDSPGSSEYYNEVQLEGYVGLNLVVISGDVVLLGGDGFMLKGVGLNYLEYITLDLDLIAAKHGSWGSAELLSTNNGYDWNTLSIQEKRLFQSVEFNCLTQVGLYELYGSNNGIFREFGEDNLELQESSINYDIRCISTVDGTPFTHFACGADGVILRTENAGGCTIPEIHFLGGDTTSACLGGFDNIPALWDGTATSMEYFINGNDYSFGGFYDYECEEPCELILSVTGTNSCGLSSSDSTVTYVVEVPQEDLNVSLVDSVLCHAETVQVQIDNPHLDWIHKVRNGTEVIGAAPATNSEPMEIETTVVDETTDLTLSLEYIHPGCVANLNGQYPLIVEQTRADWHSARENANPDEGVTLYERSDEASYFEWEVNQGENVLAGQGETLEFSFPEIGSTFIQLTATSEHGCVDVVEKAGPEIIVVPDSIASLECWSMRVDYENTFWTGYVNYPEILPSESSFFLTNSCDGCFLGSRVGHRPYLDGEVEYLAKYDAFGLLKWKVHFVKTPNSPNWSVQLFIYDILEDDLGNIFIAGDLDGSIVDNTGERIDLGSKDFHILKLDPEGKLIWWLSTDSIDARGMALDSNGDLIVNGLGVPDPNSTYNFNGEQVGLLMENFPASSYCDEEECNFTIMKVNTEGDIDWMKYYAQEYNNPHYITEVKLDSEDNIVLAGDTEFGVHFPIDNGSTTVGIDYPLSNGIGFGARGTMFKLDSQGQPLWGVGLYRNESVSTNVRSYITDFDVGPSGEVYITGAVREVAPYGDPVLVFNTFGDITQLNLGYYYVARIDPEGNLAWINGLEFGESYGIELVIRGDEVMVEGFIPENGQSLFTSQNSYSLSEAVYPYDTFHAVYNFEGELLRLVESGENLGTPWVTNVVAELGQFGDEHFISYRDIGVSSLDFDFDYWNIAWDEPDGVVQTRIIVHSESCGVSQPGLIYLDEDEDGFPASVDCDDTNPDVNPDAEEIPNNGIDEDCQDGDLIVGIENLEALEVRLIPNPSPNRFVVQTNTLPERIEIRDLSGRLVLHEIPTSQNSTFTLSTAGMYVVHVYTQTLHTSLKLLIQ